MYPSNMVIGSATTKNKKNEYSKKLSWRVISDKLLNNSVNDLHK